eukprot:CAMPEP_0196572212 /NCGR_PEP_ID=MMETSP1081-20130531/2294_1 /TAXON_ID=36882 /ORGANISM="Pyramimonas amylifera, Strain CCMP720" /LENGTH=436 /DNA_ID=CAMNT_0041889447 /DNA_START=140 /DNA_END=1450 /DNA_ORIENTATION=+
MTRNVISTRVLRPRAHKNYICTQYVRNGECRCSHHCKYLHPESPLMLPDELLTEVASWLDLFATCQLGLVCRRLHLLTQRNTSHWVRLFAERWGAASQLQWRAAQLAGSWRQLYKEKVLMERINAPWKKPANQEVQALGETIADMACDCADLECVDSDMVAYAADVAGACRNGSGKALTVIFLLDGSGSVSDIDFDIMRAFVKNTSTVVTNKCPDAKVGVLQFTTEVRVEVAPEHGRPSEELHQRVDTFPRMSGGTNFSAPLRQVEELMRAAAQVEEAPAGKIALGGLALLLISDGIVDQAHVRDAAATAKHLTDNVANVSIFALGVGRDVDSDSMKQIIGEMSIPVPRATYNAASLLRNAPPIPPFPPLPPTPPPFISSTPNVTMCLDNLNANGQPGKEVARPNSNTSLSQMQRAAPTSRYLGLSTMKSRSATWL